ncbi:MAG: hypothetical protein ACLUR9_00005 [Christensenellales bacterium]
MRRAEKRRSAFAAAVQKELADLGHAAGAVFRAVLPLPAKEEIALPMFGENGLDTVEFMLSANPGEPQKPLAKVASGGEASRIMLALKNIAANLDGIDSLIFDEIDTGISGRMAQVVAEKMAQIAKTRQVICITHLAQLASMADTHYLIETVECDEMHRALTTKRKGAKRCVKCFRRRCEERAARGGCCSGKNRLGKRYMYKRVYGEKQASQKNSFFSAKGGVREKGRCLEKLRSVCRIDKRRCSQHRKRHENMGMAGKSMIKRHDEERLWNWHQQAHICTLLERTKPQQSMSPLAMKKFEGKNESKAL